MGEIAYSPIHDGCGIDSILSKSASNFLAKKRESMLPDDVVLGDTREFQIGSGPRNIYLQEKKIHAAAIHSSSVFLVANAQYFANFTVNVSDITQLEESKKGIEAVNTLVKAMRCEGSMKK